MNLSKRIILVKIIVILFIAEFWAGFNRQNEQQFILTQQITRVQTSLVQIKHAITYEDANNNISTHKKNISSLINANQSFAICWQNLQAMTINQWFQKDLDNLKNKGKQLNENIEKIKNLENAITLTRKQKLESTGALISFKTKLDSFLLESTHLLTEIEQLKLKKMSVQYRQLLSNFSSKKDSIDKINLDLIETSQELKKLNNIYINGLVDESNTTLERFNIINENSQDFSQAYKSLYLNADSLLHETKVTIEGLVKTQYLFYYTIILTSLILLLFTILINIKYIKPKNLLPQKFIIFINIIHLNFFFLWLIQTNILINHNENISRTYDFLNSAINFQSSSYANNLEDSISAANTLKSIFATIDDSKDNQNTYQTAEKISQKVGIFSENINLIENFKSDFDKLKQVTFEINQESILLLNNTIIESVDRQKTLSFLMSLENFHLTELNISNHIYYFYCCKEQHGELFTEILDNLLMTSERNKKYIDHSNTETNLSIYAISKLIEIEINPLANKYKENKKLINMHNSLISINDHIDTLKHKLENQDHNANRIHIIYMTIIIMLISVISLSIQQWKRSNY